MPSETTPNLGLPLPHQDNTLLTDVARLRTALGMIDTALFGKATPADIDSAIQTILGMAPAALNTLDELANALGDDANFAATVTTALATKLTQAQGDARYAALADGISSAERTKLAGVAAGATANATDAQLRDRATHTGVQAIASVSGLQGALDTLTTAAAAKLSGDTVQRVYAKVSGSVALPTAIPADNSIPQSNEGTQVLTASITPTNAANTLEVEVLVHAVETSNVGDLIVAALFAGAGADAVAVGLVGGMNGGSNYLTSGSTSIRYHVEAGTTSPITFAVRVGNNNGAATLNVSHLGNTFGGMISSHLVIREIKS